MRGAMAWWGGPNTRRFRSGRLVSPTKTPDATTMDQHRRRAFDALSESAHGRPRFRVGFLSTFERTRKVDYQWVQITGSLSFSFFALTLAHSLFLKGTQGDELYGRVLNLDHEPRKKRV